MRARSLQAFAAKWLNIRSIPSRFGYKRSRLSLAPPRSASRPFAAFGINAIL
jgi:hypothetical protein